MNFVKCSVALILISILLVIPAACEKAEVSSTPENVMVTLPAPLVDSDISIEEALLQRRTVRSYSQGALTLAQVGQILWSAQGITSSEGKRTAPSAGALYPIKVYVVIGDVEGLPPGVYLYVPASHSLVKTLDGDSRNALARTSQSEVKEAPADIVITAVYNEIMKHYGDRSYRYVHMEAGHVSQNIYLQAVSLEMGTVAIGAFDDNIVRKVLGLSPEEEPLYIMPVGKVGN